MGEPRDASLDASLIEAWEEARDELRAEGRLVGDGACAAPRIPDDFRGMLEAALRAPETEPAERRLLVEYHTRMLQKNRAEVIASAAEPQCTLCHTPLDLAMMPRLRAGLDGLFTLVSDAGVAPELAFGASSPEALVAARPTVAALFAGAYFGGYAPPLYTGPNDLLSYAHELAREPALVVIDRRLTAPLVHELSHFGRARRALGPPYLDESVSAYLGEEAYPGVAIPAPGDDNALYMATWITQIGWHLARLFGRRELVRAHVGITPWEDVLPPVLVATLARLGWEQWLAARTRQLSFLGETHRPDSWVKAFWLAAGGALDARITWAELDALPWSDIPRGPWSEADDALVRRARRALTTEPFLTPEGAWRVRTTPTATRLDAAQNRLVREFVTYPSEHVPLHVVLPPGVTDANVSDRSS